DDGGVADVAHLAIHAHLERPPPPPLHRAAHALGAAVGEPVARAAAQLPPLAPAAQHHPGARRKPLDPVRVQQVRHTPHAQPAAPETGEDAPAGDLLHLRTHALEVVLAYRLGDVLERGAERLLPGEGIALRLGQERDLVAREPAVREPEVEHVAVDLPAGADDAAHRHIEPRDAAPDLELLAVGQPIAPLP